MPFVLLHGEEVIAQGPDSAFGSLGPDERVEFRSSGAAWDEIDRLKDEAAKAERKAESAKRKAKSAQRKAAQKERQLYAFAVSKNHRFATNRIARRVSVGIRGDHAGVSVDARSIESLRDEASKYESRWWGVSVRELLVALDLWLEAGCPPRKWRVLPVLKEQVAPSTP